MSDRKLASLQRITSIEPIPDADAIVKAHILGWEVVIRKDEFNVNDLVVYCEVDSILPELPEFEFLRKNNFRIRTIKLRGQFSQGICFPLSVLDGKKFDTDTRENPQYDFQEGMDVTGILKIRKYEPIIPACLAGVKRGDFPYFGIKSDETRIQILQPILTIHKGTIMYETEKIDGSSLTSYLNKDVFGVCSRNMDLCEDEKNSFWKVARQINLEEKLRSLNMNIMYQGELIGEGVQGNKYKIKGHTVRLFNLFDIDNKRYFNYYELLETALKLELEMVPILSTNFVLIDSIPELLKRATFKSTLNPEVWAEGIVWRPLENIEYKNDAFVGNRLSFKGINPEFAAKYE